MGGWPGKVVVYLCVILYVPDVEVPDERSDSIAHGFLAFKGDGVFVDRLDCLICFDFFS